MANVIFDFDGTLADTFPLIVDVSYQLSPRTRRLSDAEVDRLRRLPLLSSLLRLGIPWARMPHLIRHTRKMLTNLITKVPPFPGVPQMIRQLHRDGHKIFILSSNYPENIRRFLRYNKLDTYVTDVQGVAWGNTLVKSFALRRLARMHSLELSSCYHVGNETLDMRAARWAGMRGIALVWSGFAAKRLAKSRPFATVKNPLDLPKLLQ